MTIKCIAHNCPLKNICDNSKVEKPEWKVRSPFSRKDGNCKYFNKSMETIVKREN